LIETDVHPACEKATPVPTIPEPALAANNQRIKNLSGNQPPDDCPALAAIPANFAAPRKNLPGHEKAAPNRCGLIIGTVCAAAQKNFFALSKKLLATG
jgi:hypothetical protein